MATAKKTTKKATTKADQTPPQIADTSKSPLKVYPGDYRDETGASGTTLLSGILNEDFNSKLEGEEGMAQFDTMRKSDAQVFATLSACELPIRATRWYMEPAKDADGNISDDSREVSRFVEQNLFEWLDKSWDDFLHEALTKNAFGFSLFEPVFETDGESIWVSKLGFRKQVTIQKWQTPGGEPGITQLLPSPKPGTNDQTIGIPRDKLLLFTNNREGDNYAGVSLLRSAYKHWYYKDNLYRFDGIRHERQSVGIPVIYPKKGASPEDRAKATTIAKNLRATDTTYVLMPGSKDEGWSIEFLELKAGDNTNLFESIKHHNREISKNVLAQFLELGDTASGSRSLSEDQQQMFMNSLTASARNIRDTINKFLIPKIVDFNFDVEDYPKLAFDPIGKVDYTATAKWLTDLADKGVIRYDTDLEKHARQFFGLPPIQEDYVAPEKPAVPPIDGAPAQDQGAANGKKPPSTDAPPADNGKANPKQPDAKAVKDDAAKATEDESGFYFKELAAMVDNEAIIRLQNEVRTPQDLEALKKKGFRFNDFEDLASRPLTFAERNVNWVVLKKALDSFEEKLDKKVRDITDRQKADLLVQVKRAVEGNDPAALANLTVKYKGELAQAIADVEKEMFEVGKKGAAIEMGVAVPPTKKEIMGNLRAQADVLAERIGADMEGAAASAAGQQIGKNGGQITATNATQAVGAADAAIDTILTRARPSISTLALTGSANSGRGSIFQRYPEKVYAFQYSAILDERTTDHCRSLDGRIVKPGSAEYINYSPPQHYNCRSVWVTILNDQEFKPDFTGVPSSIPPTSSLESFQKATGGPVLLKGSPAIDSVQKELDDRKAKLADLEAAGTYPNRQAQHRERIAQLEKSISDAQGFSEFVRHSLALQGIAFKE